MSKSPPLSLPKYQGNLTTFIADLREQLFSSQEEAAAYFHLDRSRISRYESGLTADAPKIGCLAGLVQLFAERKENDPETQRLLLQEINQVISRHYRRSRFKDWRALSQTAEEYLSRQRAKKAAKSAALQLQSRNGWPVKLEQKVDLPPTVHLIGVNNYLRRLSEALMLAGSPWLVCIDGLGGIGKTTLAGDLIRQPWLADRFQDVAWVSAKQQVFMPGSGLEKKPGPALHADTLTGMLLEQLGGDMSLPQSPEQKRVALTKILKGASYLIVIDNLETLEDYEALLPTLLKLANPSKFLLTSRHTLRTHPGVFSLGLGELSQTDAIRLIRQEAEERGITDVSAAPESQLIRIYTVVGGNPLALQLVVGQMTMLSLSRVLDNLKRAGDKTIEDLYTYIYWQAWRMLDAASRQVFLIMPLAQGGAVEQLMFLTNLEIAQLNQALQQLAKLSLIQIGGALEERRYIIHRLTETFILNEVVEWKTSV